MTSTEWHLDKRVPIGLILAILVQTAALGIWLGDLNSRVSSIEHSRYTREQGLVAEERINQNRLQVDRLEARTVRTLDSINAKLEDIQRQIAAQRDERHD